MKSRLIPGLILWALGGCAARETPRVQQLEGGQRKLEERTHTLEEQNQKIEQNLSLALCRPELRRLIKDLKAECGPPEMKEPVMSSLPQEEASPAPAALACTTTQVNKTVITDFDMERNRPEKFIVLMSALPHVVSYVSPKTFDLFASKRKLLLELTSKPPLLRSTLFIVVSSPEGDEAEAKRRGKLVGKVLSDFGVPPERISHWPYKFRFTFKDIRLDEDKPKPAETKDLFRGVWVFRADC